jgi:hypothetical protein
MSKKFIFLLFFIGGAAFLFPSLYSNQWKIVEPAYYHLWQRTYERVVVARLAKSRQDGIFSAGALLGLANSPKGWNFDLDPQYNIYENHENIEHYLPYKSHPGAQGIVFGIFDRMANLSPQQTITAMRILTTLASALALSLLSGCLALKFGVLSAVFVLVFSALSEWMILPASNAYWSLWAFYVPFLGAMFLLTEAGTQDVFSTRKIYFSFFAVILTKVLFTGFEMITTILVMTTVPFIYFAIEARWGWKRLVERLFKAGVVMMTAILAGAVILSSQIAANDANLRSPLEYIVNTLGRRSALNVGKYSHAKAYQDSKQVSAAEVVSIYLKINAFNTQTPPAWWQVPYWKLIIIFGVFTALFLAKYKLWKRSKFPAKGLALTISTWYSILAPLSWYILFKPTAYIHTFLFPMAWQMPFALLGFALCGYVITDWFKAGDT